MKQASGKIKNWRTVFAWGCFDLANQSFTLLINTLFFAVFVSEVILPNSSADNSLWGWMGSISLGLAAIMGPFVGALADARGCKKRFLITSGLICATLTVCLAFLPASAEYGPTVAILCAFLIYVPANLAFNLGENLLASFLPEISSRETMGKVSSIGWTMGYVGALILLVLMMVPTKMLGMEQPHEWRPLLAFAGIWFAIVMIPTWRFLPEIAKGNSETAAHPIRDAFGRIKITFGELGRFRDLARLFLSFLVYGMGVQVIIFFAVKIAREDFGFQTGDLVIFTAVVTVFAGISAFGVGLLQDRVGHKVTLIGYLIFWTLVAAGLAGTSYLRAQTVDVTSFPSWPIWVVGIGIGIGLGGIGTATRAAVGVMTPTERTAEFFGMWGTVYKVAGVVGLPIFGLVRDQLGSVPSLIILTGFFLVGGFLVLTLVNMRRGQLAAESAEIQ